MTFTEAAALVLRLCGRPLHYKDITDIAIEKSLLSHVGKSPEVTMGSRLNALLKKSDKENPLQRVKPGVFALREWTEEMINAGLADKRPPIDCIDPVLLEEALRTAALSEGVEEEAEPSAAHVPLSSVDVPEDDEEKHRAELSQAAQDLFAQEEDDDEPIFPQEEEEETAVVASGDADSGDRGSKRRRRRRRGRGRREDGEDDTSDDLPTYTVSDAEPDDQPAPARPEKEVWSAAVEVESGDVPPDLARAVEAVLTEFEKSRNLVSLGVIVEQLRKRQALEPSLGAAAVTAAMAAENLRAERNTGAPRFKVVGGKAGLVSWFADRRLEETRRTFFKAYENLKAAQVRALSEQLARMPQRAVGEVITLLLERMGASDLTVIRRPGAHGSELHLSVSLKLRGIESAWGSLRTAVVIRRDGRDVGRERVLELRGALHHYGPAAHGWLITTGQVLSGAREEASSSSATPVSLTGRSELAELLIEHGLLVKRATVEYPTLDLELLESLAGSQ